MIEKLERTVNLYCREIISKNILVKRYTTGTESGKKEKGGKRKVKRKPRLVWDYPAVVSVCCWDKHRNKPYRGYSHSAYSNSYTSKILKSKLEELGSIGRRNSKYENPIGQCAEPHAAQKMLNKMNCKDLKDILFSTAKRPRTLEEIPPCGICKYVFPTLV